MLRGMLKAVAHGSAAEAPPPRDYLIVITGGTAELLPVRQYTAEYIRAGAGEQIGDYPRADFVELPLATGGRLFTAEVTLSARVEAENVRRLRDNALLASLFQDDGADVRRTPWQVWAVAFAGIVGLVIAAVK